jgi:beta-lactamase class A
MNDLLGILAADPVYAPAYTHMERCAGTVDRIRRGLSDHWSGIETFAHKTGSIGGVANDVGIVRFKNGSFMTICIMTCRCSAPVNLRNAQIAAAARALLRLHIDQ